ncbi:MAG: site-2 protease family protein [Candidatus Micrarchaeaceae archaeon]
MGHSITSATEIRDIIIADIVLIIAFSLTIVGGLTALKGGVGISNFLKYVPIAALAVSLSFILHEMMHKFFAQRYGAVAEFRTSWTGLVITLVTGMFGFLLGIPGATMIYTSGFTKRQDGIVSLVGPLTNLAVFGAFLAAALILNPPQSSYLATALSFTIFISILLAFFNMLPIYPLDGSKVMRWNKPLYAVVMLAIFGLMVLFTNIGILSILIIVGIALAFSLFYRFVF